MSSRSRRIQQKGRKVANGVVDILKMAAVVAVLVCGVILVIRLTNRTPAQDVFCEGISVEGVSLGGLTHDEGVQRISDLIDERINRNTYTLVYGDSQWSFTPNEFDARLDLSTELNLAWNFGHTGTKREMREQAAAVKKNPVNYQKDIIYNDKKLQTFIESIKAQIDYPPVDAQVTVKERGVLEVSQSVSGLALDVSEVKEALNASLLSGTTAVIQLTPHEVEAEYTTEELVANTVLIAEYSTSLAASSDKRTRNVERALRPFNGLRVLPGEVISFNALVGKRTKENGFFESPEYDGNTVVTGVGGGTCQASSTLYGAILLANLDPVVRGCHSMKVDYCQPSMDAAVYENKDFRFTNNLDYPVYLYSEVTGKAATVRVYGPPCEYEIKMESHVISTYEATAKRYVDDKSGKHVYYRDDPPVLKTEGKPGMKSQAFRVFYDRTTGQEVSREDMDVDTYYASQPVYWRGTHTR